MDETWVHYYTPESKQWKKSGEPTLKKAKAILSAGMVMALVFWDARGVMMDYFLKGQTINSAYFCKLLRRLRKEIQKKSPGLLRRKVLLYKDNTRDHASVKSMAQIRDCSLNCCSTRLIRQIWHLPTLIGVLIKKKKKHFGGQKFSSNEEVEAAVNHCFTDLQESIFKNLQNRWMKCSKLGGDYVEK